MQKGTTKGDKGLTYPVMTRINKAKYDEFQAIVDKTYNETISGLIRRILENRKVRVFTHDETMDKVMEELAAIRGEIKHAGININQITRTFHSCSEQQKRVIFGRIALSRYLSLEDKIDHLLEIVSDLGKKWLS